MSHYSLRLTFEDWSAIRSALQASGREDIVERMDDAPQCRLCKHHTEISQGSVVAAPPPKGETDNG